MGESLIFFLESSEIEVNGGWWKVLTIDRGIKVERKIGGEEFQ